MNNQNVWNSVDLDALTLYNLHYFDDLCAVRAESRSKWHKDLIARWINENQPGQGVGWEPYPMSIRIVNWIKWLLAGNVGCDKMIESLAIQTRFLSNSLEYHLLGNHLLANAKALVFAGLYFQGNEADKWLKKGIDILEKELPEQILDDGGFFELSPMYHAIILEDFLDLINIFNIFGFDDISVKQKLRGVIPGMMNWLEVMIHPDQQISFFNDSAFGIAAELIQLRDYLHYSDIDPLRKPPEDVALYRNSGYICLNRDDLKLLIDVAYIGADYIPGHAHADTLSFELSLHGRRLIVNSGTSLYGDSDERYRQRSTKAHNTVEINGENSSEVWGGFRVARRAVPFDLDVKQTDDHLYVRCSHDGYKRLKGKPIHTREWQVKSHRLLITDMITGRFEKAVGRLYIHPEAAVKMTNSGSGRFLLEGRTYNWCLTGCQVELKESTWHPEFGLSVQNYCIEYTLAGNKSVFELTWN
ncbi:heparinase II/III family protein [bacterium]|nr:heparinase II/III family protein [bacterium]